MKLKSTKEVNDKVLSALVVHKKLTRKELMFYTGLSDRVCRLAIAELRDAGHMIGITASGGYSINDTTDFHRAIANYKARAREEERRIRVMEKTLAEYGSLVEQMEFNI